MVDINAFSWFRAPTVFEGSLYLASYHFDVLCDENEVDTAKSQLSYAKKRADHCPEKNISQLNYAQKPADHSPEKNPTELCTEKCRS